MIDPALSVWPALALFSLVSSITPGPNNTMLLSSGVNFGFARTIPHMLGISLGFMIMVIGVGLGLGEIFRRAPVLYSALEIAGATYLLYLAWKIARAGVPKEGAARKPMTFLQAAAFQWVNPKAWVMAVSGITLYTVHPDFRMNALIIGVFFATINLPSVALWACFGVGLRRFLHNPVAIRVFNVIMAVLLVVSLYPLIQHLGA